MILENDSQMAKDGVKMGLTYDIWVIFQYKTQEIG